MRGALGFRRGYWLALFAIMAGLLVVAPAGADPGDLRRQRLQGMQLTDVRRAAVPVLLSSSGTTTRRRPRATRSGWTAMSDQVTNAGGPTLSGNIISQLQLVAQPRPRARRLFCTGPGLTGAGTLLNPWKGATSCQLPYGTTHQQPQLRPLQPDRRRLQRRTEPDRPGDVHLVRPVRQDADPHHVQQGAGRTATRPPRARRSQLYTPTITTQLSVQRDRRGRHGARHRPDHVRLDAADGERHGHLQALHRQPVHEPLDDPVAQPDRDVYTGGTVPPSQDVTFPAVGNFWFQATFSGDAADGIDGPVSSACTSEPLTVGRREDLDHAERDEPGRRRRTPSPSTVQGNDGTGFENVSGAVVNFSIAAGGVGTLTPTSCTTGANGTCTVTDNSSTAGTDVVTAHDERHGRRRHAHARDRRRRTGAPARRRSSGSAPRSRSRPTRRTRSASRTPSR